MSNAEFNEAEHERELAAKDAEIQRLRAALSKARAGLADGLWDYGPGQDEHERCDKLIAELDAVLATSA